MVLTFMLSGAGFRARNAILAEVPRHKEHPLWRGCIHVKLFCVLLLSTLRPAIPGIRQTGLPIVCRDQSDGFRLRGETFPVPAPASRGGAVSARTTG